MGSVWGLPLGVRLVVPGGVVVGLLGRVEPGEEAVLEGKPRFDDKTGIGVIDHIIFVEQVVIDGIIAQAVEQGNVAAGPQTDVEVGFGGGTGEPGVGDDELGPFVLGGGDVFKTDGMIFRRVGPDDEDAVAVGQIIPMVGHGTPTEGGPQRGHGGGVSEAGLML